MFICYKYQEVDGKLVQIWNNKKIIYLRASKFWNELIGKFIADFLYI